MLSQLRGYSALSDNPMSVFVLLAAAIVAVAAAAAAPHDVNGSDDANLVPANDARCSSMLCR
jgi:hypothetical protein